MYFVPGTENTKRDKTHWKHIQMEGGNHGKPSRHPPGAEQGAKHFKCNLILTATLGDQYYFS
jgi:hypothetical protein